MILCSYADKNTIIEYAKDAEPPSVTNMITSDNSTQNQIYLQANSVLLYRNYQAIRLRNLMKKRKNRIFQFVKNKLYFVLRFLI